MYLQQNEQTGNKQDVQSLYALDNQGCDKLDDALQAIPDKVAPAYLAGNLGEVILLASLVASEIGLRSAGL